MTAAIGGRSRRSKRSALQSQHYAARFDCELRATPHHWELSSRRLEAAAAASTTTWQSDRAEPGVAEYAAHFNYTQLGAATDRALVCRGGFVVVSCGLLLITSLCDL